MSMENIPLSRFFIVRKKAIPVTRFECSSNTYGAHVERYKGSFTIHTNRVRFCNSYSVLLLEKASDQCMI